MTTRKKAYNNFIPSVVPIGSTLVADYLSSISCSRDVIVSGIAGNKNKVHFKKRPIKDDTMSMTLSIGNLNNVSFYFRSKIAYGSMPATMSIGNNNTIDARSEENPLSITIGDSNVIHGSFNEGSIVIGNNNILNNFDGVLDKDTEVSVTDKLGSLMFDTRVSDYAGFGSEFITVADTTNMMVGGEIKFGTTAAAFARKKITKVIGKDVYLDIPLTSKEATYPNAIVFNDLPATVGEEIFYTSSNAKALSKRLPINTSADLPLREIVIGDIFTTKIFFVRVTDNIAVVKDLLPTDFPSGTKVEAKGWYPYASQIWNFTSAIDEANGIVGVPSTTGAYIGRVGVDSNGNSFTILGFTSDTLTIDLTTINLGVATSEGTQIVPETKNVVGKVVHDTSADSNIIRINTAGYGIKVGDILSFSGFSEPKTVLESDNGFITISSPLMPSVMNDTICFGKYIVDRNQPNRETVEAAGNRIHNYLFGDL